MQGSGVLTEQDLSGFKYSGKHNLHLGSHKSPFLFIFKPASIFIDNTSHARPSLPSPPRTCKDSVTHSERPKDMLADVLAHTHTHIKRRCAVF